VLSALGAGGMGEVFLAHDTRLNRRVALKLLPLADGLDVDRLGRFVQEARAASALTHPNVAIVYDIGKFDGHHYIAMEHVEGRSLAEHLRGGPLSTRDVISIGSQIAEALQAAHAVGIVHRDVKPANVMITPTAQAKVLDFGLAKFEAIDPGVIEDETRTRLTGPHVVLGTAAYMSPEQSLGVAVDHRTDLFSLGVLLYESASGRLPFRGATTMETMDRLRHSEPERLASTKGDLAEEFDRVVRKCLAKEPDRRYQSAGELLTDLRMLARQSDSAHAALVSDQPRHNLPADLTTFVGRSQEVEQLVGLVGSSRLVTLTGAGGAGKTRLAQQLGGRLVTIFAHGAWFVDLAPMTNPDLLPNAIARVLDVPEKAGARIDDTLLEWLRPRRLLLILDNCEHLVDACAAFAEPALRHAPTLGILATSREALNVPGEAVWRVPPLAVPATSAVLTPEAMLGFDAVRLFVDRAAAVTSFQLTAENAPAVADICRRLDGVPLALELAAARTKLLSVGQISERLNDRFRLLAGGGRTVVARQRTLEATVAWSYELLSEGERRLLVRLSVFSGGWTLEAAEQVCGGRGIEGIDVLDLLSRLVDKSLVVVDDAGADPRYRLLETIRQYARDRLVQSGDMTALGHAHLDYYLALAREAESTICGADQAAWLNRLDQEHDNLRVAIEWSLGEATRRADALALANCLWWFWAKRGYLTEGFQRLGRALAEQVEVPIDVEARALIGVMHLLNFAGDHAATGGLLARALSVARAAGDGWSLGYALNFASFVEARATGDSARCLELAREARDVALRSSSSLAWQPLALAIRLIGYDDLRAGRLNEASRLFEESLALLRKHGDIWSIGILQTDLAGLRVLEGRHGEARACQIEALSCAQRIRDLRGIGWCLQSIAMLEAATGRTHRAAWLVGASQAVLDSIGATGQDYLNQVQDVYLGPARRALGEAAFSEAENAGRATPLARILEMDPGAFASG
jgi:non-specific serine/threonine protein kinase